MRSARIAPDRLHAEKSAKSLDELACPFCGQKFELTDINMYERHTHTRCVPDDRQGRYVCRTREQIPVALRCLGCGVELRSVRYIGCGTRTVRYNTSLERQK